MSENHILVLVTVLVTIFAFVIGMVIASSRYKKRINNLRQLDAKIKQLQAKHSNLKEEISKEYKLIEEVKQEAAFAIKQYKGKKDKATIAIEQLKMAIQKRQQEYLKLDEQTCNLQKMLDEKADIEAAYDQLESKRNIIADLQEQNDSLVNKISLYSEMDQYIDNGLYPLPSYGELSAGAYAEHLKENRAAQKESLREGSAYTHPENIEITGNSNYDKRIAKQQGKLLVRAFNSECDYIINKISTKNYEASLTRIEKLAAQLEKLLVSLDIGLSLDYVALKMEEAQLYYQYICKKEAEAEEQREIRAQIREEAAAQREIERAIKAAEHEEQVLQDAMNKVRVEMEAANEAQREKFKAQLENLALKLEEAEARGQRALSMAQQTKQGHVYVISNIGSFGEDVYKIGMTRRLEPLDRVKELGDASVPFSFDVHAMIYSENAPALEKELHAYFSEASMNKVNPRKEFFEVPLKEIRDYLQSKNIDTHWTLTAEATEYRQSLQLAENIQNSAA